MAILADAPSASLHQFVSAHVEPGATIVTDAWQGYHGIGVLGYERDRRSQRAAGEDPAALLLGALLVTALTKRWLLGTHQKRFDEVRLQSYLDEFVFRFNPRESRSLGLLFYRVLELTVVHNPVRYSDIAVGQKPRLVMPTPPRTRVAPTDPRSPASGPTVESC